MKVERILRQWKYWAVFLPAWASGSCFSPSFSVEFTIQFRTKTTLSVSFSLQNCLWYFQFRKIWGKWNSPRVNLTLFLHTHRSVLWLSGSVRYLLSLTQWKRRELKQNGGRVNHLSPIMHLPNICKHWNFSRSAQTQLLKMMSCNFNTISPFDNDSMHMISKHRSVFKRSVVMSLFDARCNLDFSVYCI